MDLEHIEKELRKRLAFPYNWHHYKQSDEMDKLTNFIYSVSSFEQLINTIDLLNKQTNFETIRDYSLNRWFNFWSAKAVEYVFCTHSEVEKETNSKSKIIDFTINGIAFDHKTSIFPSTYNKSILYAKINPKDLIKWLYKYQSSQQRQHFSNRLFIVLYSSDGEHWKLKANLLWLKKFVDDYVSKFNIENLVRLEFENTKVVSDIIWACD